MPPRRHRRAVTVIAAAGLLVGPVALPSTLGMTLGSAFADNLDDKKEKVEDKIDQAEEHLDHSNAELEAATAKLLKARDDLAAAQAHLAKTQGELAAAEALDREMQVRLDAAIERLNRAQLALDEGQAGFAEQETRLRQMVVSAYEHGDPALMGLSMVFTTQDPAQLTGQLNADDTVIDVETTILDQLEAGKVLLLVKETELAEAKADVAAKRREAAANLRRMEKLEEQARQAKLDVAKHVAARQQAMTAALKAKNKDLAIINKLKAERDRIQAMITRKATMSSFTGYVDGGGVLAMPVDGYVTSPFGWRTHPIWGYRSLHDGVDFGAGCGTPIRAAADGVVLSQYYHSAWGNRIIIDHGLHRGVGVSTISNHLSGYAVSPGARVTRGQVIGYVGTTGWSTGCHLHYTVNQNGAPVDPMNWF